MSTVIPTIKTLIKYMDVKTLEFKNLLIQYVVLDEWELETFILNNNPFSDYDPDLSCHSVSGQHTHQITRYVSLTSNEVMVNVEVVHVLDFAGKLFRLEEVHESYELERDDDY